LREKLRDDFLGIDALFYSVSPFAIRLRFGRLDETKRAPLF
jgi:hypothetical protein